MDATPGERKALAAMASLCSGPISCQSTRTPGEGSTVKAAGKAMSGDLQTEEVQEYQVKGMNVEGAKPKYHPSFRSREPRAVALRAKHSARNAATRGSRVR